MQKKRRLLKISHVILLVNVTLLLVMVSGLNLLTIYENSLIRQTETELNTQAFLLASMYKSFYFEQRGEQLPLAEGESWNPILASLDLDSHAIQATEGQPAAVAGKSSGADIAIGEKLVPILKETQRFTLASIQIVDENALVVSATNTAYLGLSMLAREEVVAALKGQHTSLLRQRIITHEDAEANGISRIADFRVHVVHPVVISGKTVAAIVLSRTPYTLWQIVEKNKIHLMLYVISAFLLAWMVSFVTALVINRPIAALVEQANRALKGEKSAVKPLANPMTQEVDTLSRTFSSLSQTLEQRSEYILEFASHVSHEFKTPVTAMQGALELLIDHNATMTTEERLRFLNNLQKDSERLQNLVLRLLEFARADLKIRQYEIVDVLVMLHALIARFEYKQLHIELIADENSPCQVLGSQEALDSIFTNLLSNAIQAESSALRIEVWRVDGQVHILVSDNGKGISDANKDKIFTPFFTTKRNAGGTGLGLAIIRSLLMQLHGRIDYKKLEQGEFTTQFIVILPAVTHA